MRQLKPDTREHIWHSAQCQRVVERAHSVFSARFLSFAEHASVRERVLGRHRLVAGHDLR
jgi:hypothetical protein